MASAEAFFRLGSYSRIESITIIIIIESSIITVFLHTGAQAPRVSGSRHVLLEGP
jgi:hypothetical protein